MRGAGEDMAILPRVARIRIHPVKSLDGLETASASVSQGGSLEWDRRFAMEDRLGRWVNAKRYPSLQRVRAVFDLNRREIRPGFPGQAEQSVPLEPGEGPLARLFSDYLGFPVIVREDSRLGFPDDTRAYGPTIISTATLETAAGWFPGVTLEEARLRFRANIEIEGVPPFWEDRLFTADGTPRIFWIGGVEFHGVNPCARCAVPGRNPWTADETRGFQKIFSQNREAALQRWSARVRFDHFYRLAVNTRIPPEMAGKWISVGDPLTL
ncbi:MAG: hypothetical protein GMKNLPBB_02516 [Myxococcota bacterium]|nr:hypothetical protein [Myxococcota bacterium]